PLKREKGESEKPLVENPLTKITRFLTVPQGIPKDTPEIVDTQCDLSQNAVAEMLLYHRTIANRFAMLDKQGKMSDVITGFANRISLLTWANNRRSRGEAVEFGKHLRIEEHEPIETEHLGQIPLVPVEPKKKKRLGII
ncbi:unnamed protein product, partial [marine sediment metagenome]